MNKFKFVVIGLVASLSCHVYAATERTPEELREIRSTVYELIGASSDNTNPTKQKLSVESSSLSTSMGMPTTPELMFSTPAGGGTDSFRKPSKRTFSQESEYTVLAPVFGGVVSNSTFDIYVESVSPLSIHLCDNKFQGGACEITKTEQGDGLSPSVWTSAISVTQSEIVVSGAPLTNKWLIKGLSCNNDGCEINLKSIYTMGAATDGMSDSEQDVSRGLAALNKNPMGEMLSSIQENPLAAEYLGERDAAGQWIQKGDAALAVDAIDLSGNLDRVEQGADVEYKTETGEIKKIGMNEFSNPEGVLANIPIEKQESADGSGTFAKAAADASAAEQFLEYADIDANGNITVFGGEPSACKQITSNMWDWLAVMSWPNPLLALIQKEKMKCCKTNPEDVDLGVNFAYCKNDLNARDWMDAKELAAARMAKRAVLVANRTRLRMSHCINPSPPTMLLAPSNPLVADGARFNSLLTSPSWYLDFDTFSRAKICGIDDGGSETYLAYQAMALMPFAWGTGDAAMDIISSQPLVLTQKKIYWGRQDTYCVFPSMLSRIIQEQGRNQINALAAAQATGARLQTVEYPYFADGSGHAGNIDGADGAILAENLAPPALVGSDEEVEEFSKIESVDFSFPEAWLNNGVKNQWDGIKKINGVNYNFIVGDNPNDATSIYVGYCPEGGDCRLPTEAVSGASGDTVRVEFVFGRRTSNFTDDIARGFKEINPTISLKSVNLSSVQPQIRGVAVVSGVFVVKGVYQGVINNELGYNRSLNAGLQTKYSADGVGSFAFSGLTGEAINCTYYQCSKLTFSQPPTTYTSAFKAQTPPGQMLAYYTDVTLSYISTDTKTQENYDWKFVSLSRFTGQGGGNYLYEVKDTGEGSSPAGKPVVDGVVAFASCGNVCKVTLLTAEDSQIITPPPDDGTNYHENILPDQMPNDTGIKRAHWLPFNMANGNKFTFWQWDSQCKPGSETAGLARGTSLGEGDMSCPIVDESYIAVCSHATKCNFSDLPPTPYEPALNGAKWVIKRLDSTDKTALTAVTKYVVVQGGCDTNCSWKVSGLSLGMGGQLHVGLSMEWAQTSHDPQGKWDTEQVSTSGQLNVVPYVYGKNEQNKVPKIKYCLGNTLIGCNVFDNNGNPINIDDSPSWHEVILAEPVELGGQVISTNPKITIQGGRCDVSGCSYKADMEIKIAAMPWVTEIRPTMKYWYVYDTEAFGISFKARSKTIKHYEEVFPNCSGFTLEQFMALDFEKIDLSEYVESLTEEAYNKFMKGWNPKGMQNAGGGQ